MTKFSLQGHVALITGNSTGLGKSIGLELGKAGAKVAVNFANNEARAKQAFDEYKAAGIDTGALGLVYWFARSTRALPPWLRVHPLALVPMSVMMPVAYLVLTPLALFTLDTASWETRGHVPGAAAGLPRPSGEIPR